MCTFVSTQIELSFSDLVECRRAVAKRAIDGNIPSKTLKNSKKKLISERDTYYIKLDEYFQGDGYGMSSAKIE